MEVGATRSRSDTGEVQGEKRALQQHEQIRIQQLMIQQPPLTDTFNRILPATCLQEGANPPPPLTNASAGKFYLPEGSNPPPLLTDIRNGIVPSTDLQWDQIRHPL